MYQPSAPRPSDPSGKHHFSSCPPNLFHMHLAHASLHVLPTTVFSTCTWRMQALSHLPAPQSTKRPPYLIYLPHTLHARMPPQALLLRCCCCHALKKRHLTKCCRTKGLIKRGQNLVIEGQLFGHAQWRYGLAIALPAEWCARLAGSQLLRQAASQAGRQSWPHMAAQPPACLTRRPAACVSASPAALHLPSAA